MGKINKIGSKLIEKSGNHPFFSKMYTYCMYLNRSKMNTFQLKWIHLSQNWIHLKEKNASESKINTFESKMDTFEPIMGIIDEIYLQRFERFPKYFKGNFFD